MKIITRKTIKFLFIALAITLSSQFVYTQQELKSIDEVIDGIDSLLGDIDPNQPELPQRISPNSIPDQFGDSDLDATPFRVNNELMPDMFLEEKENPPIDPLLEQPLNLDDVNPNADVESSLPRSGFDYRQASIEELLKEVDALDLPEFEAQLPRPATQVSENAEDPISDKPVELLPKTTDIETTLFSESVEEPKPVLVDDYMVLGEVIDHELKEDIREAILATRRASGGSNNPYVTKSVFKASSYCNRVLGRLNAPHHKRYRRDILLSLIGMHERNQAWVDAAKSYERYLEEFAADDSYPFEDHEDAPGIPDLKAQLGSVEKWLEGRKRGAPTIPETHIRTGKIYRELGAHRMAFNKFYDAINATLTLPENPAFELADRKKGGNFESRMDAESNQAMFEIAETFMDSEDYDNAIKFFDRLLRLEQMIDSDRSVVRFKKGLAHYRRASENLKKEERMLRLPPEERNDREINFDQTPRADFAKVKESLRGYGTLYPESPYVPEAHYLLALTYEQLNQDDQSVAELLKLLKEADFNPQLITSREQSRTLRDRDQLALSKLKSIWNFWKKKTGNYLANKFFEDNEYFNAYRIYNALRDVDSSPSWQIPILYQIALCEEKLGNYVQAMETYTSIEEYINSEEDAREGMVNNEYLKFVYGMVKWRRDQLEDTRSIRQAVNRYGIYTLPSKGDPEL
jgi:tetratricopeptide (TPR) repeat protein